MILATLLSVALAAAPVPTQAPDATARSLFDAGGQAYAKGRYADAARAFEAAHELFPRPEIAFSWAQALRRQYFVDGQAQHLQRAIALYHLYLDQTPEGGRREDAVDQLQQLEPLLVRVLEGEGVTQESTPPVEPTELMVYTKSPGASVEVDGNTAIPAPALVQASPGAHEVRAFAPGFEPTTVSAVALVQRMVPVEVELQPLPATLSLTTNRAARIQVDGRDVGQTPLAQPLSLPAGVHALVVSAPGRVRGERTLTLERGETVALSVQLPRTRQRDAALGLLGTSAGLWLGGGLTLGFALRSQDHAQKIDALRGESNISTAQLQAQTTDLERRDSLRGATIGLWSAAAVAGVVGLVLMLSDRR